MENFCETDTGQCPCKMGIDGLKCDTCIDTYYGLSNDGCEGKWIFYNKNNVARKILTIDLDF